MKKITNNILKTGILGFSIFIITLLAAPTHAFAVGWTEQSGSGSRNWESITTSIDGSKIAAVVKGGYIYTSADGGFTWTERTSPGNRYWLDIASSSDGTKLAAVAGYMSTSNIWTSDDSGVTWTEQTGSGDQYWSSIASSADGTKLAATASGGSDFKYIYTSDDSGVTWTPQTDSGDRYWADITSSSDGTKLAAVVGYDYIYTSDDSGATWTAQTGSLNSPYWITITSSADGTKLAAASAYGGGIYTSDDSGVTWTEQAGSTGSGNRNWKSLTSSADGTKLAVTVNSGTDPKSIYTSDDSGATWTEQTGAGDRFWTSIASSADGTKLIVTDNYNGTGGVIYFSTDNGSTWITTGSPSTGWKGIASSADGAKLVAAENYMGSGYLYTSTDAGSTWTKQTDAGSHSWGAVASSTNGVKLVAIAYGTVYTSTNSGTTWTEHNSGFPPYFFDSLASSDDGTKIAIASSNGTRIWTSDDSGATWTEQSGSESVGWKGIASSADGTKLAAVDGGGDPVGLIYTSINSGVDWISHNPVGNTGSWKGIASSSDGMNLVAIASNSNIFTSTDGGDNWTEQMDSGQRSWSSVASSADGTKLVAGTDEAGPGHGYVSVDSGATWTEQTTVAAISWNSVASSSNGSRLAMVSSHSSSSVWTYRGIINQTLSYSAGAHGSVSGNTNQTVLTEDDGSAVTANPDTGYHFVNWSDASTENPRTDTNIQDDISVTANFAINTYTLDYIAGTNGSILGTSPQTVTYNSDGTSVYANPATGYHFVNWSDSVTDNPRTDINVAGDVSVTANFASGAAPSSGGGGSSGGSSGGSGPVIVKKSITINNDEETTNNTTVNLQISYKGVSQMMVSNDIDFSGAIWETYKTSKVWTVMPGNGKKVVYIKFKSKTGSESSVNQDTILFGTSIELIATTPITVLPKGICPLSQTLNQNLKTGARNGVYHSYTKTVVKEAAILQGHLNRLGFASGAEDGILGPISDGAIKRMQKFLGTYQDGMVGPITRGLINNSCNK